MACLTRPESIRSISTIAAALAFCACLCCAPAPVLALYVAKNGSDSSDCATIATPCLTVQRAIDKIPWGGVGRVDIAAGVYEESIDVAHRTFVYLSGDCNDWQAVNLRGAQAGVQIVWVQDRTTAAIACLTMNAAPGISGVRAISARQFVIADCNGVRFGAMPDGVHPVANETAKISCTNYEIAGGAALHANVGGKSTITLGGSIRLPHPASFSIAFVNVGCVGDLDASSAAFSGYPVGGKAYVVRGGQIYLPHGGFPATIPGDDLDECPRVLEQFEGDRRAGES